MRARRGAGPRGALDELLTPALGALLGFQVVSGILVAPLFVLFPIYVEKELQLPSSFSGNLRALSVLLGGAVGLVGGTLCDRLGRKTAYLIGMTGVSAGGLMFLAPPGFWPWPLAGWGGLMFGLGSVAGQAYLMEAAPRRGLGLATAAFFMTGTVGNAAGSAAASWVASELPEGYRLIGWTMALGQGVLLLLAWWLMPEGSRPAAAARSRAPGGGVAELLRRREVRLLLAVRFLPTVYWGAATFLMPLLLFRLTGSEKPAGVYTAASLALTAVCQLTMGRLVDRVGVRTPVVAAISVVTLAALGQGLFAESLAGLVFFGLLGAGAAWALSITMTSLIQALAGEEERARFLGITHMAWAGGFLSGTLLGGYLGRASAGAPLAFLICAGGCAAAVVAAALVVRAAVDRREAALQST